jgi:hypothetical protein
MVGRKSRRAEDLVSLSGYPAPDLSPLRSQFLGFALQPPFFVTSSF